MDPNLWLAAQSMQRASPAHRVAYGATAQQRSGLQDSQPHSQSDSSCRYDDAKQCAFAPCSRYANRRQPASLQFGLHALSPRTNCGPTCG